MTIKEYDDMLESLDIEQELKNKMVAAFKQGKIEALTAVCHFLTINSLGHINGEPAFGFTQQEWEDFYNRQTNK